MNKDILNEELIVTGVKKNICLNDLKGKNVVLYFYPKDSTPGCTIEGRILVNCMSSFQLIIQKFLVFQG